MYNLITDEPAPVKLGTGMANAMCLEAARRFAEEFKTEGEIKAVLFLHAKKVACTNGKDTKAYYFSELL